jgi:hypothetical protein
MLELCWSATIAPGGLPLEAQNPAPRRQVPPEECDICRSVKRWASQSSPTLLARAGEVIEYAF